MLFAMRAGGLVTERVSVNSQGVEGTALSQNPSISADGRLVEFASYANNLLATGTGAIEVYVRDRAAHTTEIVSISNTGQFAGADCMVWGSTSLSADGRYALFQSKAGNLVPNDTNGTTDIFVHDRLSGSTDRASTDSAGNQGNAASQAPALRPDARQVAFQSFADQLVAGDTNGAPDVFVADVFVSSQCGPGVCGNGVFNPECREECDAGAANSDTQPDACRIGCQLARCGDGVQDSGEECDDGNLEPCDGCSPQCTVEPPLVCGDGLTRLDCGEQCDDGGRVDGDGCSSTCQLELIPGGGARATDCFTEWGVVNPHNKSCATGTGASRRSRRAATTIRPVTSTAA